MSQITIKDRRIGDGSPVYIIAEMSANHAGSLTHALEIVHAAKEAGADCIKIQTYTPDTLTIDCKKPPFIINGGLWDKDNLYSLYTKAYMPWEWQADIKKESDKVGIDFFSTPFDLTAVDFLESIGVEFYKIASFEIVDIPLIEYTAKQGKPIIMSCGMATEEEISEAVKTVRKTGNNQLALLKCSSAYPAKLENMNLATIKDIAKKFDVVAGLSDHSIDDLSTMVAVSCGAKIIEKHFCIDHEHKNPDSAFSLDFCQMTNLVKQIRNVEKALGNVEYGPVGEEKGSLKFRKSIFVVDNIKKGEMFTSKNIKVIRPSDGLHPRYYYEIIGKKAAVDIEFGTPLKEDMIND